MNVTRLTYLILGEKLSGSFDSKIYVDWAVKLMQNDFCTESLVILAGLDRADTEEREKYFWKALEELDIRIEKKETDLLEFYVTNLVDDVLNGNVTPKLALAKMCEIVRKTDYGFRYMGFYMLDDDIDRAEYEGQGIFTEGLNRNNVDEFIVKEFRQFKKILEGDFSDYFDKAICNNCRQIMVPVPVKKYRFMIPFTYQALTCPYCKSSGIETFSSPSGKEKIIRWLTAV